MGTDQAGDATRTALADRLGTEAVSFVDDLNDEIATTIEDADHLRFDYLAGDVSDCGVSSNGHTHFDLVHNDSSIHCICFQYRRPQIDADLEDGLRVAVKGDLSYYEDGGSITVIVEDVVALGDGEYQQTYEENRQVLADDGLLDPETKRALPERPRRIGIATSAESDAREDAVTSVHSRYPDVDVVVRNTTVQGTDAMASMMEAISALDDDARVDVIVLTRGGGADKHLRVFNETPLCRVIHGTETPIVVGVGHENDRTLADEVADRRVMTPTHVGEIVPRKERLAETIGDLGEQLDDAYETRVTTGLDAFDDGLDRTYDHTVEDSLGQYRTTLDHAFETLASERLTGLDNRLDTALKQAKQRTQHRRETEQYRKQRRRLAAAILLLLLLVGMLGAYILIAL